MRSIKWTILLLAIFLLVPAPCKAFDLPCWDKPSCFTGAEGKPAFGLGLVERMPNWHKRLEDIPLRMRQDYDYSIFYAFQKDRIPYVHTPESQRAVDEFAGDVISTVVSPLTYRLPLFPDFEAKKKQVNATISGAMPEIKNDYYSVHFLPRVDFSRTNPVSLDIKIRDGRELANLSFRIRETEITAYVCRGVVAVGGYSFRDSAWYISLAGKIILPW